MTSSARDPNAEPVGLSRDGARRDHDLTHPVVVGHVSCEDRVDPLQRTGLQHHPGAPATLLGRLEYVDHIAGGRIQDVLGSRAQHHGHVGVVAARMHATRNLRREG